MSIARYKRKLFTLDDRFTHLEIFDAIYTQSMQIGQGPHATFSYC